MRCEASTPELSARDAEFTEYVQARRAWLRRAAYLLCQDWHSADDLVQAVVTRLYVRWGHVRSVDAIDAYVSTILVRHFLAERRSAWARRVTTTARIPDVREPAEDHDAALDVRTALNLLPPRQRATLVLRFYFDLNVGQAARMLGCSSGTVKSQTAKGLGALRQLLEPDGDAESQQDPRLSSSRRVPRIGEGI